VFQAVATGSRPLCAYCAFCQPVEFSMNHEHRVELACDHHVPGAPARRVCDLFVRAVGSEDE